MEYRKIFLLWMTMPFLVVAQADAQDPDETPGCDYYPQDFELAHEAGQLQGSTEGTIVLINTGSGTLSGEASLPPGGHGFSLINGGGPFTLDPLSNHEIRIRFAPLEIGAVTCTLSTGLDCPDPVLSGLGLGNSIIIAETDTLDFGVVNLGSQPRLELDFINLDVISLPFDPMIDGEVFSIYTSFPIDIGPGQRITVGVQMDAMAEGVFEDQLYFDSSLGREVTLRGEVVPDESPTDRIGFFFDQDYTTNHFHEPGFTGTLYGFLVLMNPENLEEPIYRWQACIAEEGDPAVTLWSPEGGNGFSTNDLSPPCFDMSIALPLPTQNPMVLLSARMFASPDHSATEFYLDPVPDPAIPGRIAYGTSLGWRPLTTNTGERLIASFNTGVMTPVELPAPLVRATGGTVHLTWDYFGEEAEGFHVYRRIGSGAEERLTASPVLGVGGSFTFADRPDVFGPAQLTYVCAAVKDGVEIARGAEVTVLFSGVPRPRDLALRSNYPNPFNPSTTVPFEIAKAGRVRLTVFDLAGRQVAVLADGEYGVGYHEEVWLGKDTAGRQVPSGAYYLRLESGGQVGMRQMMLLK